MDNIVILDKLNETSNIINSLSMDLVEINSKSNIIWDQTNYIYNKTNTVSNQVTNSANMVLTVIPSSNLLCSIRGSTRGHASIYLPFDGQYTINSNGAIHSESANGGVIISGKPKGNYYFPKGWYYVLGGSDYGGQWSVSGDIILKNINEIDYTKFVISAT